MVAQQLGQGKQAVLGVFARPENDAVEVHFLIDKALAAGEDIVREHPYARGVADFIAQDISHLAFENRPVSEPGGHHQERIEVRCAVADEPCRLAAVAGQEPCDRVEALQVGVQDSPAANESLLRGNSVPAGRVDRAGAQARTEDE